MNHGPFDRWFKDQLQHHASKVPNHIWEGVQQELLARERKKRHRIAFWLFLPLFSLGLFSLGWWLGLDSRPTTLQPDEISNNSSATHSTLMGLSDPLPPQRPVTPLPHPSHSTSPFQSSSAKAQPSFSKTALTQRNLSTSPLAIQNEPLHGFTLPPNSFLPNPIRVEAGVMFHANSPAEIATPAQTKVKTKWLLGAEAGLLGQLGGIQQTGGPYLPVFGAGQGWTESNPVQWQIGLHVQGHRSFGPSNWGWYWNTGLQYQTLEIHTQREHISTYPFNLLPANTLQTHIYTQWGMLRGVWIEPNLNSVESEGPVLSTDDQLGETTRTLQQTMGWVQLPWQMGLTWKNKNQKLGLWTQVGGSLGLQTRNEVWATGDHARVHVGQTAGLEPIRLDLQGSIGVSYQPGLGPIQLNLGLLSRYSVINLSHASATSLHPVQLGGQLGVLWRFK